jgi:hypothetical protein
VALSYGGAGPTLVFLAQVDWAAPGASALPPSLHHGSAERAKAYRARPLLHVNRQEHPANINVIARKKERHMSNPKTEPTDNTQKDPDEWVSGDDPMTGAQASYLKTLCEQAGTPEMFENNLTKAQASKLIDEMREKANV